MTRAFRGEFVSCGVNAKDRLSVALLPFLRVLSLSLHLATFLLLLVVLDLVICVLEKRSKENVMCVVLACEKQSRRVLGSLIVTQQHPCVPRYVLSPETLRLLIVICRWKSTLSTPRKSLPILLPFGRKEKKTVDSSKKKENPFVLSQLLQQYCSLP